MKTLGTLYFFCLISFVLGSVKEWWTREKCIEELGCFYAGKPFFDLVERPISLLPDDREGIDTKFYLYTRQNRISVTPYRNFDSSLDNFMSGSGFNPYIRTKFIIPGFMSRLGANWKLPMTELLLGAEDSNVFIVDWDGGDGPFYEQAVANTRVVGAEIAQFIKTLQTKAGIKLNSIHLIGHSLGAHIAGYAGKRLNKIGRITALDPAGPYFVGVDPVVRLDRSDAKFVDAIHTNAAPSRLQGFGLTDSIAHFDFWPNGGHLQPGCSDLGSSILSFLSNPHLDYEGLHDIMCNHDRAIKLFLSSIGHPECKLTGVVCDSWEDYTNGNCFKTNFGHSSNIPLGLHAEEYAKYIKNNASLNLYLETSEAEPYCKSLKSPQHYKNLI